MDVRRVHDGANERWQGDGEDQRTRFGKHWDTDAGHGADSDRIRPGGVDHDIGGEHAGRETGAGHAAVAHLHSDEAGVGANLGAKRLRTLEQCSNDRGRMRRPIRSRITGRHQCWTHVGLAGHELITADHLHRMSPAL